MSIERASGIQVTKPWGSQHIEPWGHMPANSQSIGEIWFQRELSFDEKPDLLFKLLFTTQPLSIQVHPDDAYAHNNGLENGKTEAWYILAAKPGARVGVGLTSHFNKAELLEAISSGEIENALNWHAVRTGDVVYIPAGTVHAIGPGLVIAEIQQASDTTFRMFDYGRQRTLHAQEAVNCAKNARADIRRRDSQGSHEKRLLVACPYFTFVAFDLPPDSRWTFRALAETWALGVGGEADFGGFTASTADALFIKSESVNLSVGPEGFRGLVATASPSAFSTMLTRVQNAFPPQHDSIAKGHKRQGVLASNQMSQLVEASK